MTNKTKPQAAPTLLDVLKVGLEYMEDSKIYWEHRKKWSDPGKDEYVEAKNELVELLANIEMFRAAIAKAAKGSWIVCAEHAQTADGSWKVLTVKTVKVDDKKIKADTYYCVKGGKWVEA